MTEDDEIVIQKVSVSEIAEVRDQLRQLVRIGIIIMIVIVGVQGWGVWQNHEQGSCAHDIAAALNSRASFNTQLDDITAEKFELDKALTNRKLSLEEYNKQIDRLTTRREHVVAERDSFKYPTLANC